MHYSQVYCEELPQTPQHEFLGKQFKNNDTVFVFGGIQSPMPFLNLLTPASVLTALIYLHSLTAAVAR